MLDQIYDYFSHILLTYFAKDFKFMNVTIVNMHTILLYSRSLNTTICTIRAKSIFLGHCLKAFKTGNHATVLAIFTKPMLLSPLPKAVMLVVAAAVSYVRV
jgi:hypothetical protein